MSRRVPTIRRGHRFVSCCMTVVLCIQTLAVVVSLKYYAAPPLLDMSDKKVTTAVPGMYWYTTSKSK